MASNMKEEETSKVLQRTKLSGEIFFPAADGWKLNTEYLD